MLKSVWKTVLALFLAKSIWLTPVPIDLFSHQQKVINSGTIFDVLDNGAALYIYFPGLVKKDDWGKALRGIVTYPGIDKLSVLACDEKDICVPLYYKGLALEKARVSATYRADWDSVEQTRFSSIRISSDVNLKGIKLRWSNSGK